MLTTEQKHLDFIPQEQLEDLSGWIAYLEHLTRTLNELPELRPVLDKSAPVVFQYCMQDFSEYNYWWSLKKDGVKWALGENTEENIPKVIHKANLDVIKKINAGDIHPVQARMDRTYSIDGDMRKFMECTPLLPIIVKAHAIVTTGSYIAKEVAPVFKHKTDLEKLYVDIVKSAEIAEVPYDSNIIHRVLGVYKDFFSGSTLTFTTNTVAKEKRRLAVRYVEFQVPHDPYAMALATGLLNRQGHPIEKLQLEIQAQEDILGYGTDLAVDYGVAKIWSFLKLHPALDDLCARLPSLPDSVRQHLAYFEKYGLKYVTLFGLDFRNKTVNSYFMVKKPGLFPSDKIAAMLGELDLKIPTQEILEHCSKAMISYFTFTWDSSHIERACFGVTASDVTKIPTHFDPLLERYVHHAPILTKERKFIYNITSSRQDIYIKIENDYTNSMVELMQSGVQIDPS